MSSIWGSTVFSACWRRFNDHVLYRQAHRTTTKGMQVHWLLWHSLSEVGLCALNDAICHSFPVPDSTFHVAITEP